MKKPRSSNGYEIKKKLIGKHQVYLTRSYDKSLTLDERSKLAQKLGADIFVSVHANSSSSNKSQGFETFYLSNSNDEAVKKVVRLENSVAKNKKNEPQSNDILDLILAELVVGKTVPRSKKLAEHIHSGLSKSLTKKYKMRDRGIKPGLFYVLAMSKVPGVLLEMGFMSNKKDLKLMKTKGFIESYANEVANGIDQYFKK